MEVQQLKRVFKHGSIELPDTDESVSPNDVLDFYSGQYPELTNASVQGPEVIKDKLVFTFSTSVGTKG